MNPEKLTVIAIFQARPGKEEELRTALIKLIAPTLREHGCFNYDLHEAKNEAGKFLFYENWESKEDLNLHLGSVHVKELLQKVDELCTLPPEITFWKQLKQLS